MTIIVPDDYSTIQEAVNAANSTDTVYVRAGTYYEHVTVGKTISLVGESKGETIIDGNGTGRVVILNSTGVIMENLTIRKSGPAPCGRSYGGIYLGVSCSNSLIINNIVTNGSGGVEIYGSFNNTLESNTLSKCRYGVELIDADENIIHNNTIVKNGYGVMLASDSNNNSIRNNMFANNTIGIYFWNSPFNVFRENILTNNYLSIQNEEGLFSHSITQFDQDIDESNLINGKPVCYLVGKEYVLVSPTTFPDGVGYLGIVRSKNIAIRDLHISNVNEGVFLAYTTNSTIQNVTVSHFYTGIFLINSTLNGISDCMLRSTSAYRGNGIWLKGSHNNSIQNNNISKIGAGINFYASSGNTVTKNTISNGVFGICSTYGNPDNIVAYNNVTNCSSGIDLGGYGNIIIGNRVSYCGKGIDITSRTVVAYNILTNNGWGIWVQGGKFNKIFGNVIVSSDRGITTRYCSDNLFYHNTVYNSTIQVYIEDAINTWSFNQQGNYWGNYNGADSDRNGIGDTPFFMAEENQDDFPLMGMFSEFKATSEYDVQTISSSSISGFEFNGTAIIFNVFGDLGTVGFCRICIPKGLMDGKFRVFVNGTKVGYNILPRSNNTHNYLYFSYSHSTQEVIITERTIVIPDDYSTIQDAINVAKEGDYIFIRKGTYLEHVIVNKTVSLVGEDRETTIIEGFVYEPVVEIQVKRVNISELTIQAYNSYIAVKFYGGYYNQSSDCNFKDSIVIGSLLIQGEGANNITVSRVVVNGVISIDTSQKGNTLDHNILGGIELRQTRNNTISNNVITGAEMHSSTYGIYGYESLYYNVISGNLINTSGGCGLCLKRRVGHNILYNNTFLDNNIGIELGGDFQYQTYSNRIIHNNFINNTHQAIVHNDSISNFWDNGCEGNYWNNYNGTDSNDDGVGDTYLPWEGVDYYPLMNRYWNPCDINHDLLVNMMDVGRAARAFATKLGDERWNPHADITGPIPLEPDGEVNMRDIGLTARNFGKEYS